MNIKLLEINPINYPSLYVSVFIKNRNNFTKFCKKNKIGIHLGTRCIHETHIIKKGSLSNFTNSTYLSKHLVRLPCGPGYDKKEILKVIKILNSYKN